MGKVLRIRGEDIMTCGCATTITHSGTSGQDVSAMITYCQLHEAAPALLVTSKNLLRHLENAIEEADPQARTQIEWTVWDNLMGKKVKNK